MSKIGVEAKEDKIADLYVPSLVRDETVSTNMRVTNFAVLTLVALVGLGVWQVFHLRNFFKRKYLID